MFLQSMHDWDMVDRKPPPTLHLKQRSKTTQKNLAKELAPNILVNAVAPGRVNTPMWSASIQEQKKLSKVHLIKRMIEQEEIADAILFLVKNNAICGEI